MTAIPALTLHRPWAALILLAGKDVENRGWMTGYRGPLLIHAGQTWDEDALDFAARIPTGPEAMADDWVSSNPDDHAAGIIGVVELVDVVRDYPSPWSVRGQYQWVRTDPHMFLEPIPCKGRQGLWIPPDDVQAAAGGRLSVLSRGWSR